MKNFYLLEQRNQKKTGAAGCLDTLKDSYIETEAGMEFSIIQEISSIVTDGTNMNSGERGGLWVLLEKLRQQQAPDKESLIPLIKIWCAVHRSNLAWKSVTETVTELVLIKEPKGISTYFHTSGVRLGNAKQLLKSINCLLDDTQHIFKSASLSSCLSS